MQILTNQWFAGPPSKSGQFSSRLEVVLRISEYIQPDFSPICGDENEEISLGPNVDKKWPQNLCKGFALTISNLLVSAYGSEFRYPVVRCPFYRPVTEPIVSVIPRPK